MKRWSTSTKAKIVASREAKQIKILERTKNKLHSSKTLSCFVLVKKRNHAARSLKAIIMNQPQDNYYRIYKNVIAIRDKKTKKNVLIVSFTQFKDIEGKNKYVDLNKLTKSLMQLKIGSNLVSSNGAQKRGCLWRWLMAVLPRMVMMALVSQFCGSDKYVSLGTNF